MRLLCYTIFLLSLVSCDFSEKSIEPDTKLIFKLIVLDEYRSPMHNYCSHRVKNYSEMGKYDCSFKLPGLEFNILEKFVVDNNGALESYWSYKAEGPLIYQPKDFETDQKFYEYIGPENFNF